MRFLECLAVWLQQFDVEERETAYAFVRGTLTYVGPAELQRLVEQLYPRTVRSRLNRMVAAECEIPPYRVLADNRARTALKRCAGKPFSWDLATALASMLFATATLAC